MKRYLTYIAIIVVFSLLSCNKTGLVEETPGDIVSFQLRPGSEFFGAETKAVTATSLTSFKCEATTGSAGSESSSWNNIVFTSDGAGTPTYNASPAKYWPLDDPHYNFYAVAATASSGSSHQATAANAPDLSFVNSGSTISMAAGYNKDVICAYEPSSDITWKTKNTLAFEHIFARISTVNVTAVAPCAISDVTISIVNPKTGGTYNLRTGHGQITGTGWSSLVPADGTQQQLYRNAGSIASGANHTGSNNDFYIVPGTYKLKATWTASVDDYSQSYSDMVTEQTITIQKGKVNSISCSLSGDPEQIKFTVSVTPWGSKSISGLEFYHSEPKTLPGVFSVSATKKVRFAPGNLWAHIDGGPVNSYIYTADQWGMYEHQWEYSGQSIALDNTVDTFGWVGSSATYDSYGLCSYVSNDESLRNIYYGGAYQESLKTSFEDIPGVLDAIGSGWYTLDGNEWLYLINRRDGSDSYKYGHSKVGDVYGLVILPDDFSLPANCSFTPGKKSWNQVVNIYTLAESGSTNAWCDMEDAGCLFLPCAGARLNGGLTGVNSFVFYTLSGLQYKTFVPLDIESDYLGVGSGASWPRAYGGCIRFVKVIE